MVRRREAPSRTMRPRHGQHTGLHPSRRGARAAPQDEGQENRRTRDAGASGLMGKITGFLEIDRHDRKYAPVTDRVQHYREFVIPLSEKDTRDQAARCMNCGIPYCHGTGSVAPGTPGCPVNNQIPDFNDLVYQGNWEEASRNLHSTNNFPEFTGRICPAPCEASCTLNIDDNPVTIKTIECAIVDRAWDNGWLK